MLNASEYGRECDMEMLQNAMRCSHLKTFAPLLTENLVIKYNATVL